MSKDRQKREEELNSKYQDMLKKFQENPCEATRLETEKVKNELEALCDEKVEGIIIRSRARWHEHGEKNSKYFLNLEKRNNIKKHIRKLFISGSISSDPFEILNAEKLFYSKLYSKQRVNRNSEEANSFFQNPNIIRLSEELSAGCEGEIIFQECETILGSFHTGHPSCLDVPITIPLYMNISFSVAARLQKPKTGLQQTLWDVTRRMADAVHNVDLTHLKINQGTCVCVVNMLCLAP